jgi:hypothetical protein
MDYQVPQFVDVEDKIFGPLTFKQFVYLAGGIGIVVGCLLYLPLFIGVLLAIPAAGLAGALAFYKMNGKPFIDILESGFNFFLSKRLYLWKKEKHSVEELAVLQAKQAAGEAEASTPARTSLPLTTGKLHDLALSLDIKRGETGEE